MRTLWQMIALLAWALWLGGLITTFIFVLALFHEDHALAAQTAPRLFHVFERYQLILAGAALGSAILWRRRALSVLFFLAAIGAVVSPLIVTPRIMDLQQQGLTHTEQFAQLHGESMMIYTADSAILLGAVFLLTRAIKKP